MNNDYLFSEIEAFMLKVKRDYQNNIIDKDKYDLMYFELSNLSKISNNTDFLILATKLDTIKTIYLIVVSLCFNMDLPLFAIIASSISYL